jgi:uncharacterized membrane protein YczE
MSTVIMFLIGIVVGGMGMYFYITAMGGFKK